MTRKKYLAFVAGKKNSAWMTCFGGFHPGSEFRFFVPTCLVGT